MCTPLLNPFLLEGYTDHGFSHHGPHSKDLSSIWTKTVDRYLPIKRILHPRDPLDLGASVSAQEMTEWHRSYIRASITTPSIRRHHTFAASHASGARASCSRCSGTSMDAAKPAPRCARTFVFEVCNLASASRASCPSRSKPSGLQGWGLQRRCRTCGRRDGPNGHDGSWETSLVMVGTVRSFHSTSLIFRVHGSCSKCRVHYFLFPIPCSVEISRGWLHIVYFRLSALCRWRLYSLWCHGCKDEWLPIRQQYLFSKQHPYKNTDIWQKWADVHVF